MPSLTNLKLALAGAPHLHAEDSAARWIWWPFFALLPALITSFVMYGLGAVFAFSLAAGSAVGFESLFKPRFKIGNSLFLAALLTFLTPQSADWRMIILGSFVAVVVIREFFGGFGQNLFQPALAGFAVSLHFFPEDASSLLLPSGVLGMIFVCTGGLFLILKKWARWEIPLFFLTGALTASIVLGTNIGGVFSSEILLLGAFFLAADVSASPITRGGRLVFAFSGGGLAVLWGQSLSTVEALAYSLLLMNTMTPLLDSAFRLRRLPNGWDCRPRRRSGDR